MAGEARSEPEHCTEPYDCHCYISLGRRPGRWESVFDVLARREAGCCGVLRSFKGVRDVLAGRGAG